MKTSLHTKHKIKGYAGSLCAMVTFALQAGPAKGSSKLGQLMRKEKEQAKVRAKEQPLRNPRFGGVFLQTTVSYCVHISDFNAN